MNFAFCFDDKSISEKIEKICQNHFANSEYKLEIISYKFIRDVIFDIDDGMNFDAVFIYVKNNISAIKLLRSVFSGKIVVISSSEKCAVDCFAYQVYDYLIIPFYKSRMITTLNNISKNSQINSYQIKTCSKTVNLPINDIISVQSDNTRCIIRCISGQVYSIYKKLDDIEAELNDKRFLRCHKSYLVNMNHIFSVDKNFTMSDGSDARIRQRTLFKIKNTYLDYKNNN